MIPRGPVVVRVGLGARFSAQRCLGAAVVPKIQGTRTFFSTPEPELQTFKIRKMLGYSPELMYQVISEVEMYSMFVPYCTKCEVAKRDPATGLPDVVRLHVGWNQFSESFESKVKFDSSTVTAEAHDTHIFDTLYTKWAVSPIKGQEAKCLVDFTLKFAFKNPIYGMAAKSFGPSISSTMVKAFQERAANLTNSQNHIDR